ncbi:MAG: hypothetical protein J0L86_05590 [Flavobacteriales bacterium]|nr:hypothetical protein [Flavobacteriales bacterium]
MDVKNQKKQRKAVVVIHGIGNQLPMATTRELVESLKDDTDILYSSPDREANFFETRRLSLSGKHIDFYEFYWANLVVEPSNSDLMLWLRRLLFFKDPSTRAKNLVMVIRVLLIVLACLFLYLFVKDILASWHQKGLSAWNTGAFTAAVLFVFKVVMPSVNRRVAQTVGDAVKYLTSSPQNIDSRYKIRQKGIQLLKKLHEKKDKNGKPLYSKIIIVGHSLGSVVGYDLITNLWHDYIYDYAPEKAPVLQPILNQMSDLLSDYHQNSQVQSFPTEKYNQLQEELYAELKSLNNPWLISDFITVGSPLCHGAYIMAKNYEEFDRRTNYREIPLNPPKIEVKRQGNEIVKDYDNAISYKDEIKDAAGNEFSMRIINHSSQFAFIRWNNIYFSNDYVGGDLNFYFGEGIQNQRFIPKGSFVKKYFPVYSHTHYWDAQQTETVETLKKLIL